MKSLNIHYAGAWNFLPFGSDGIEIHFDKLKNIVFIRGENRDVKPLDSEDPKTSSNGCGKCFRINTPILMYDGSIKKVQDIEVNDLVMGVDSKPRKVLELGRGREQMYEIRPEKGESYFVNESHILHLKNNKKRLNILVKDYLNNPKKKFGTYRVSVNFKYTEVPLDPHLLGKWLCGKYEDKESFFLKNLESFNTIRGKHIPFLYLVNSKEVREKLLYSLIESGALSDKELFNDISYLARSLGYVVIKKKKKLKLCKETKSLITVHLVGIEDYYGFTVDGDHLFLLGDFTVVHNSSLEDILSWTIYGKTIKKPNKIKADDVINNITGKNCKTVVKLNNYRIERGRKPNFLRLWENDVELTQGDMRVTQKKIEEIIGLSYEAFVNICVFTDDQSSCFLECDTTTKREIVENLLSLSIYRQRHEITKEELKNLKNNIKSLAREYEIILSSKKDAEKRVEITLQKESDWRKNKLLEIKKLIDLIKQKTLELKNSDTGNALIAYQNAQERIKILTIDIASLEEKQDNRKRNLSEVKEQEGNLKEEARKITELFQDCKKIVESNQGKIKEKENFIAKLDIPGTTCDKCFGIVEAENIEHVCKDTEKEISDFKFVIKEEMGKAKELNSRISDLKIKQDKIKEILNEDEKNFGDGENQLKLLRNELVKNSQVREPKANSVELLLQQQIEELKEQAKNKKIEAEGISPFVDIIANDKDELDNINLKCLEKEKEVKEIEELVPYYEYWLKAYGDNGIRKWVIDGIIPALNKRIAYWLQFLIDNKIEITFNNQLEETIKRTDVSGLDFIYFGLSAGQRRRINLAVSQAFAYIMMASTNVVPSLVFLDEVTTNIDALGVSSIYKVICELAEEKQVFVTTHDPDLIRLLQDGDVINLVHEGGITVRE